MCQDTIFSSKGVPGMPELKYLKMKIILITCAAGDFLRSGLGYTENFAPQAKKRKRGTLGYTGKFACQVVDENVDAR